MTRTDALLAELAARHGNRQPFLTAVRPMVERILAPDLADSLRIHLLELLAETCERDTTIRVHTEAARAGWAEFFTRLEAMVLALGKRG